MKRTPLLMLTLPLLLAPSCPSEHFEITMQRAPDGNIRRTITVWQEEDSKIQAASQELLSQIEIAYRKRGTVSSGKATFVGAFAGNLPADLLHEGRKNHGSFAIRESHMGTSAVYVERMPGQVNWVAAARAAQETLDTFIRAMLAYAERRPELKAEPEKLARLRQFMKTEFRDDILNVGLLCWAELNRTGKFDDDIEKNVTARIGQFLVEREYFDAHELLVLSSGGPLGQIRGPMRRIATALGHDPVEPLPPLLAELSDPEKLENAFEEGLAAIDMTMDDFQKLFEPLAPEIFGTSQSGSVTFKSDGKPISTNGEWNAAEKAVKWEAQSVSGPALPQVLHAAWAEPNREFQMTHFGKLVLTDELPIYNQWIADLAQQEKARWITFLDTMRPGPHLVPKLEAFRFPPLAGQVTPKQAEEEHTLAGAEFILRSLDKKQQ